MRRVLMRTALLSALMAALLTLTAAASVVGTGVITADSLRLRSEPNTDCATVTYLTEGTGVQVYEELDGWYEVSYGEYTGYVSAEYVDYTPIDGEVAEVAVVEETTEVMSAVAASAQPRDAVVDGSSYINLRTDASNSADIITTLDEGTELTVLSVDGEWCCVEWEDETGYVNANYIYVDGILMADPRGIVTGSCVNVRSQPSTDSSILTKVYAGSTVELISLEDGWYVMNCDGVAGYISAEYVYPYNPAAASAVGAEAVELAMGYMGVPYVYGGSSSRGFDCSGFTMYIYGLLGYSLPHSATSQWESVGTYVERSDLQPGDLVLFCDPSRSNGKACSHVGIYIGNNEFIHASSSEGVRINGLDESYYDGYDKGAKRLG